MDLALVGRYYDQYERFDANRQEFAQVMIAAETQAWGEVIQKNSLNLD